MEAQTHFDLEGFKYTFSKLFDLIPVKLIVAQLFLGLSWAFDGKVQIIATIYALIIFDTFTGIWAAIKRKDVSSRAFYRVVTKTVAYSIMAVVGRLVDKNIPLPVAGPIIDAFLVTTEAVSILENFGKIGIPVPMFLINKLKSFYIDKEKQETK